MRYRAWQAGVVVVGLAAASGAHGQSLSGAINGAMDRTSALLQQPAGIVPVPSKSEQKQRKTGARGTAAATTLATRRGRSVGNRVPVDRNSLAGVPTTTHSLSNGVVLQVTGDLVPEAKATCTTPCR